MLHVPPELSSFVGRAEELAAIGAAVAPGRVLTLAGPGGCGKTRLAIRTCHLQADSWPDGVVWGALDAETDPDQAVRRIADAVSVLLPNGPDPAAALATGLEDSKLLLVLDNCEQVLGGAAYAVSALLTRCPQLAVLATSRAPLAVPGEVVWRVPPLALPDALELFRARAGVDAADTAANTGARRVCDRLDRLPLALELAAGWARTLTATQIADSLRDPYELLDAGVPFRQQTLEGSMRWSHDLLDEPERVLFRRLAVLEPGFTADMVTGLVPGSLPALRGLIDKSLVVSDTTGEVAVYRMLEVIRAYALAQLESAGETASLRDRHLSLQLDMLAELEPLLVTDKDTWVARVRPAYPGLRAAVEWGLSLPDTSRGRRLAAGLAWFWHLDASGAEGVRLLQRAVEAGGTERSELQASVLVALALASDTAVAGPAAYDIAAEALAMASEVGAGTVAPLARSLAAIGHFAGDFEVVRAEAERARDEALAVGDGFVADFGATLMGLVHLFWDDHAAAVALLEPAVAGSLRRGDRSVAASGLGWLAQSAAESGSLERAVSLAGQAVEATESLRDSHRIGSARSILAELLVLQGRLEEAAAALEPVSRLVAGTDESPYIPGWERTEALLALADGRPEDAVAWCWREGAWQEVPSDQQLQPGTRLVLATALRLSGQPSAAVLEALLPVARAMPRLHASVLDEQALLVLDDTEAALALHHEALRIRVEHSLVLGCIRSLESLASLALRRSSPAQAGVLLGAASAARTSCGFRFGAVDLEVPPEAFEQGRSMSLEDAVAYAARMRGPRRRPDSGWESLTPTERSVVDLAVQGLSNPEIAAKLFMSRGTVKTHLGHVYAKLQVANRTELANRAAD